VNWFDNRHHLLGRLAKGAATAGVVGLAGLGASLTAMTVSANTGTVVGTEYCTSSTSATTWNVNVSVYHNIAPTDMVVVTTTIPGTTNIGTAGFPDTAGAFQTTAPTGGNPGTDYPPDNYTVGTDSVVTYSGTTPQSGTVTLYIYEPATQNGVNGYSLTTDWAVHPSKYSFTIAASEGCATPTTTTTAASVGGVAPQSVTDTATVTQGSGTTVPIGTITFNLYGNASCSGTPVFGPDSQPLSSGTATSSPGFGLTLPGTYYWTASYTPASGSEFAPSSSACGATGESVTITSSGSGTGAASTTTTSTPAGSVEAASTPTTGADLFLPGLLTAFALLFGGLLVIAGIRLQRRSTV